MSKSDVGLNRDGEERGEGVEGVEQSVPVPVPGPGPGPDSDQGTIRTRHRRSSTLGSLSDRTADLINTHNTDSGWQSAEYYTAKLSKRRNAIRNKLEPAIIIESDFLYYIQANCRNAIFDFYFSWTANFGSHTFYVLMLPIPLWFGYQLLLRDLVFVIGWGIFITGVAKDYLCLPRPRSPPLHRITMSHYTAQEYGCPSSHSANATGVTLVLMNHFITLLQNNTIDSQVFNTLVVILAIYYISLIFGRIYCGMHGITDIITGSIIGITTFIIRHFNHTIWDSLILKSTFQFSWIVIPGFLIAVYFASIYYHPTPLEPCPCFEDSVAFAGVMLGLELIYFFFANFQFKNNNTNDIDLQYVIPYSYNKLGLIKSFARLIVGVGVIFIWKSISKPILYRLFSFLSIKQTEEESKKIWVFKKRLGIDIIIRVIIYAGIAILAVSANLWFKIFGIDCQFDQIDYV